MTIGRKFKPKDEAKSSQYLALEQINLKNGEFEENLKTYYIHPVTKSLVARSKTAAVPLPDPTVSRRHGSISFYGGKYYYTSTAEAGSYYLL